MGSADKRSILDLDRYLPYRLSLTSNLVSSALARTYQDKFALSVTDWRIMAVLAEKPGASADDVCQRTQVEKSMVSRGVSRLLGRRLISRRFDETDRRRSQLSLTKTGKAVYEEIVPSSREFEDELLSCLSKEERRQLTGLLDKLYSHVITMACLSGSDTV